MSIITTVKAFTSSKFQHVFTLVFADRTRETSGGYWDTVNRAPGGWVTDLHSPHLLGVVSHPRDAQDDFGILVQRPDGRGTFYGKGDILEDAIQEVRTQHAEMVSDVARREVDPIYTLECELKCHDWYYCMSDDGSVYRAGAAHWNRVVELLKQSPVNVAHELWAKYAPKDFPCPV